jgi:hypothetical protein
MNFLPPVFDTPKGLLLQTAERLQELAERQVVIDFDPPERWGVAPRQYQVPMRALSWVRGSVQICGHG